MSVPLPAKAMNYAQCAKLTAPQQPRVPVELLRREQRRN